MKYLMIIGDGMADYPLSELGDKTPLQAANTANIDRLCALGRTGFVKSVPEDLPPGSAVANLSLLGYDVHNVYQGRGVLEAASMGVQLKENDIALRCNLICVDKGKIKNHSAGHISTPEAHELIKYASRRLGNEDVSFYPGVSYRHLVLIRDGSTEIACTPPHDVPGGKYKDYLVRAEKPAGHPTAKILNSLTEESLKILADHPVNKKREKEGKDPGNCLWFWSPGKKPDMKTFQELYGLHGAVISAVDLVKGIGALAGMDIINVKGATGLHDTNYEGKADAAFEALKGEHDFVYLHIEASDEAGHEGNAELKKTTIEYLDSRIVGPLMQKLSTLDEPVTIALLPDHATPCDLRTHTRDYIPFIIYNPDLKPDDVKQYDESLAGGTEYGRVTSSEFFNTFIGRR